MEKNEKNFFLLRNVPHGLKRVENMFWKISIFWNFQIFVISNNFLNTQNNTIQGNRPPYNTQGPSFLKSVRSVDQYLFQVPQICAPRLPPEIFWSIWKKF